MARPHIEYIQSQWLPWRKGIAGGARPDVFKKILSIDKDDGSCSLLVHYPPGWSRTSVEHLRATEEFFVLDGALTINDVHYEKNTYAFLPAGFPRRRTFSTDGAVVLTFFSRTPVAVAGSGGPEGYDRTRLIEYHSAPDKAWGNTEKHESSPEFNSTGTGYQLFREDPDTGERTWILGVRAFWQGGNVEIHPVVEEAYVIAGSMIGGKGERKAGAYFWRPPGLEHGPMGSPLGAVVLFRCVGGPLTTTFIDKGTFTWDPEYEPVLPPHLMKYADRPYTGGRNY
jgi:hypothetical protein